MHLLVLDGGACSASPRRLLLDRFAWHGSLTL